MPGTVLHGNLPVSFPFRSTLHSAYRQTRKLLRPYRPALWSARQRLYELIGNPRFSQPGLYDLDRKLAPYLNMRRGFFVELGANDGFTQSNTYYLEQMRGWRGILIEPIPALAQQAARRRRRSRVFNCACVPFDFPDPTIEMTYSNLMSLVRGAMKDPALEQVHIETGNRIQEIESYTLNVPVRTLTSIFDECGVAHIDFLSLDVEGYELDVLRGLDLQRYRPTYLLIEARFREAVDEFLAADYDTVDQLTGMDVLYRRKDVAAHAPSA